MRNGKKFKNYTPLKRNSSVFVEIFSTDGCWWEGGVDYIIG